MKVKRSWIGWGHAILVFALGLTCWGAETNLPNILWITAEDINPHLGCYGDSYARTPNLDRFAQTAQRYTRCWSSAPVCAPARTTLITGVYPTRSGSEHMRSSVPMPESHQMVPQLMRKLGYYCSNNSKEDYNLLPGAKVWDDSSRGAHWTNRPPGKPFFAVFNIELSHEGQIRKRPHQLQHDPAKVRLPAYHPDAPEVRHDWAQYYDNITAMDAAFGRRLGELQSAGMANDTIVFFFGDNGSGMPRSKRWPYNSGLNVPLMIRFPGKFSGLTPAGYSAGGVSQRLVSFVDFAPTLISLAGQPAPSWMDGRAFAGKHTVGAPKFQFGFRGRMDERMDFVRTMTDGRYVYVRNYLPHLIYGQYLEYMFETPATRTWRELFDAGKLNSVQQAFWKPKPFEELYDLSTDADEVQNLASDAAHATRIADFRNALRQHLLATRDLGFMPEAERHRQKGVKSFAELGADASRYPLERILAQAELAASPRNDPKDQAELSEGLGHADAVVRYWSAIGILIRGSALVAANREVLLKLLGDESPSVRVVSAELLCKYGSIADQEAALRVLGQLASPANGTWISLEALNAIDALGSKGSALVPLLRGLPASEAGVPDRIGKYPERLRNHILSK